MSKKNYKFDDESRIQPVPIEITKGKYIGLKFQYGSINFDEQDGGGMSLNFDYNILNNPSMKTVLEEDQEFIDTLGKILMDVIQEELEEVGEEFLREPVAKNEDS